MAANSPRLRYGSGWIEGGGKTLFIEPGSPWENGYVESCNGKLRDELLNGEIFYTLREAQVIIEGWRLEYNTFRPHSSLGYRPPVPETVQWPSPRDEKLMIGLTQELVRHTGAGWPAEEEQILRRDDTPSSGG